MTAPRKETSSNTMGTLEGAMPRREFLKLAGSGLSAMLLGGALLNQDAHAYKRAGKQAVPPGLSLSTADTLALANAKDFSRLANGVEGLSNKQIAAHLGLYQGYVKKHAEITQRISAMTPTDLEGANATYHPYRALITEQSFALNGAMLHEYYFENISPVIQTPSASLQSALATAFGSMDMMKAHLMAAAKSMRGWAILATNPWDGQHHIYGLDTHNTFAPMGVVPLLVLDVYEHAYMIDYATNRAAYLDAFWSHIDWSVVEARLRLSKK